MPLKLTCPQCISANPLVEPLPLPGASLQCRACGATITVTHPQGAFELLKSRGKTFDKGLTSESPTPPVVPASQQAMNVDDHIIADVDVEHTAEVPLNPSRLLLPPSQKRPSRRPQSHLASTACPQLKSTRMPFPQPWIPPGFPPHSPTSRI